MTQARIYEASPRKLAQARKRGQAPRTPDLGGAAVLLTALLALGFGGGVWLVDRLRETWTVALSAMRAGGEAPLVSTLLSCSRLGIAAAAPLLAVALAAGCLADILQIGPRFSFPARPAETAWLDWGAGLRRLWSARLMTDVALACLKVALLTWVVAASLYGALRGILGMLQVDAERTLALTARLGGVVFIRAGAALALIAALDYLYRRHRFRQDNRMTREELERERRETEVDPRVEAARRRLHQQLALDSTDGSERGAAE